MASVFLCFSCTAIISPSSPSISESKQLLRGKFTLSSKDSLSWESSGASFEDERGLAYSLQEATSSSTGWFSLSKNGLFANAEESSFYFTSISVSYLRLSSFGSLLSKASNYAIASPANGAFALQSGETYTFGTGESFAFFSLYVPVGEFQINSITLAYDNALPHEKKDVGQLDFYTINDVHGAVDENPSSYHAGIEKLGSAFRKAEQANPDGSVVLSSGDMWQGSADSNLTKGMVMVDWMNGVGFESMAIGNHEFDWLPATIEENARQANFPFLGINIRSASGEQPAWAKTSKIIKRGDARIGVIGAIGPVEDSIAKSSLSGCHFEKNYPSLIEKETLRLKKAEACDLVIVSLHYGSLDTSFCPDVDAVFEGHAHQNYETVDSYGIPHVQTYGNGSNIQHVAFTKTNGKYVYSSSESFDYSSLSALSKDPVSSDVYSYYLSLVVEKKNEVVGTISSSWGTSYIASLSARLMYEDYKNDDWSSDLKAAFVNKGCARQAIPAGEVTYGQIYASLPFDNDLILYTTSGANLKSLLTDRYLSFFSDGLNASSLSDVGVYDIMVISYVGEKNEYAVNLHEVLRDSVNRSRDLVANYLRRMKNV